MKYLELSDKERTVLHQLQDDMPDDLAPYDILAERAGIDPDEFVEIAQRLLDSGLLRKVTALLNHYQAGFKANAMCIWKLPAEDVDAAGEKMAQFTEVTHCYRRPVNEDWPYAIFCMVHGRSKEEAEAVVQKISDAINPIELVIVYSTHELKKRSLRLPL